MTAMAANFYFVICRLDRNEDGSKGKYALCRGDEAPFEAKRQADDYAKTINPSREPIVLMAVSAPFGAGTTEILTAKKRGR